MDRATESDEAATIRDAAKATGTEGLVGIQGVGPADPASVPPPEVSGGLGGTNDGTQVAHHSSTAVPGKPMAPITNDPAGGSTDEAQAMDTPVSSPHAERGGG